jgi:hypothetical protein
VARQQRPLSVPEMRGMRPDDRPDSERPYSAASYAAQYGIGVEEAQDLMSPSANHGEVKRRIYRRFTSEPALRAQALMLDGGAATLTPEEEKLMRRGTSGAATTSASLALPLEAGGAA